MEVLERLSPYVYPGIAPENHTSKTIENILDACYSYFEDSHGITRVHIKSKVRKRHFVDARRSVADILCKYCRMNDSQVGEQLNIDRTSVIHYKRGFDSLYEHEYGFKKNHDELLSELAQKKLL